MKILAFDLDDTILNSSKCISERTIRAMGMCRQQGHRVGFITARSPRKVGYFLREILYDFISCYNGAITFAEGEKILDISMPHLDACATVRSILQAAPDIRMSVNFEPYCYRDGHVMDTRSEERLDGDLWSAPACGVQRMHIHLGSHEALEITQFAGKGMDVVLTKHNTVVITAVGANKGAALRAVTAHFGVPRQEVWSFGDDTSDIPMFQASGEGIAVENAVDALKEVSTILTGACDAEGVASFLETHVLQLPAGEGLS